MGRIKRSLHFGGEPAKPVPVKPEPALICPRCDRVLVREDGGYWCPITVLPGGGCGWIGTTAQAQAAQKDHRGLCSDPHWPINRDEPGA